MKETFQIDACFRPTNEDIELHWRKLTEYMVDARPDLARESEVKRCTFTVKNKDGQVIGGAYMYASFGNCVVDAAWIAPEARGQGAISQLGETIVRQARVWKCDQVVGYSADFLGAADIIQKKFGTGRFATLDCPAKGYKLHYYRFSLKPE